jgi:Uma2 family endonuclease
MTVLDTPEERQTVFPVSVEFYHEAGRLGMIGEDVELLDGVIFKKMPKSPLHEYFIACLRRLLEAACGPGMFVEKERPITCRSSEPEPDLAVFAGNWTEYRLKHPTTAELVIEIAINTQQRDRSKAGLYAEAGVKEYWLVEPEAGVISLYTVPGSAGYAKCRSFASRDLVTSTVIPAFNVTLEDLMK